MRVFLPAKPVKIVAKDTQGVELISLKSNWDEGSKTCWLSFENNPDGVQVEIKF